MFTWWALKAGIESPVHCFFQWTKSLFVATRGTFTVLFRSIACLFQKSWYRPQKRLYFICLSGDYMKLSPVFAKLVCSFSCSLTNEASVFREFSVFYIWLFTVCAFYGWFFLLHCGSFLQNVWSRYSKALLNEGAQVYQSSWQFTLGLPRILSSRN